MQNYNKDTKFDMVKTECQKDYGALKWEEGQPNFYLFEGGWSFFAIVLQMIASADMCMNSPELSVLCNQVYDGH